MLENQLLKATLQRPYPLWRRWSTRGLVPLTGITLPTSTSCRRTCTPFCLKHYMSDKIRIHISHCVLVILYVTLTTISQYILTHVNKHTQDHWAGDIDWLVESFFVLRWPCRSYLGHVGHSDPKPPVMFKTDSLSGQAAIRIFRQLV